MLRVTIIFSLAIFFFSPFFGNMLFAKESRLNARQQRYEMLRQSSRSKRSKKTVSSKTEPTRRNKNSTDKKLLVTTTFVQLEQFSFSIPSQWQQITDKTQLPEKLEALCIGQTHITLTPTITIASEKTKLSLDDYINVILDYHRREENTIECSLFTALESKSGIFKVIKAEKLTGFGETAFVQAVLIRNRTAYIFTGICLKEDIADLSNAFLTCVYSFKLNTQEHNGDSIENTFTEVFDKLREEHNTEDE